LGDEFTLEEVSSRYLMIAVRNYLEGARVDGEGGKPRRAKEALLEWRTIGLVFVL